MLMTGGPGILTAQWEAALHGKQDEMRALPSWHGTLPEASLAILLPMGNGSTSLALETHTYFF